ncbi:hypothetical protein [Halobellus rubicundus]|uniref:Uncharacterized protein n=1 Tax=Halobellus rubicundus TaxID=2996466 RepID=A0ABD5MDR1_9EURY
MASTSRSAATTPGEFVIAPHGDRLVLAEIVDVEPRPTFPNPEREVLTVRVDGTDTTIQVLASDAEPATDDAL